jgi:Fe-S-cluster containining protein
MDKGPLEWHDLVTFLKGEPAWDPARGMVIPLPSDMVKIRGREGVHLCCFYDDAARGCSIYAGRPLECRTLKCWDTREIEALFLKDMLSRRAICNDRPELLELLDEYDRMYGVEAIREMLGVSGVADHAETARFVEASRVHRARSLGLLSLDERAGDFLFGRDAAGVIEGIVAARRYGL